MTFDDMLPLTDDENLLCIRVLSIARGYERTRIVEEECNLPRYGGGRACPVFIGIDHIGTKLTISGSGPKKPNA